MLAASQVVLWCLVVFLLLLSIGVLGEVRRLRAAGVSSTRLPLGSRAPRFSAIDVRENQPIDSRTLGTHDYVLLFISSRCSSCRELIRKIRATDQRDLVVVCRGENDGCKAFLDMLHQSTPFWMDPEGVAADQFGIAGWPMAVMVKRGRIEAYGQPRNIADFRHWRDDGRNDRRELLDHDSRAAMESRLQQ